MVTESRSIPSVSPIDVQRWSDTLVDKISSDFSSLDEATKIAVAVNLRSYMTALDSDPSMVDVLLDLYSRVNMLSVPELQECFSGVRKSNLLRGLGHRIYSSTSSVSPDEVRQFGTLAAEGLSASELGPTELGTKTEATLRTLEQAEKLGEMQPDIAVATTMALAELLQMQGENDYLRRVDALCRLSAIAELNRTAHTATVRHNQELPEEVLSALGASLPDLIRNENYLSQGDRVEVAKVFLQTLRRTAGDKQRKDEVQKLLGEFSINCSGRLTDLPNGEEVVMEIVKFNRELLRK